MDGGSSQSESTFKKIANGTHTITVEDFNGCRADSTFALNSQYDIEVPNFFTPNGDGFNDTWEIGGLERLPESMISIYDRFGKLLVKYPASNPGWNGEYMNRPVPSDDYWYVIELKPVDKIIKGNVTIKR
jgi:gliding motility-associated-like protein